MKKLLFSLGLIFACVILPSCSNSPSVAKEESKHINSGIIQSQTKKSTETNQETEDGITIAPYIPFSVTYKDSNVALLLDQHLYLKHHTQLVEKQDENNITKLILKYVINDEIKTNDLTSIAIKHSFISGVQHITASPTGKYIALEFGAGDCNETVLINTEKNAALLLQESGKIPMVSVSWKYDNDDIFAYFTTFINEREIKAYDLKTNKSKVIGTIKDNHFDTMDTIINWKKEFIEIIGQDFKKLYKCPAPAIP